MYRHLWSYYFNSSSNQVSAFINNSELSSITKDGKFLGTSKSVILEENRSELISHLASYAREIHIPGQEQRQIWIFSARISNSPLKQCCELGDRCPGHWMRWWGLITSPLSSTGHLTFLVGVFFQKQYVMSEQYLQIDKLNWSLKLLKLCLQRCYDM